LHLIVPNVILGAAMRFLLVSLSLMAIGGVAPAARAQWLIEPTGSTASLRGIHSVNGKIAWASGTNGTILRTLDGGASWQACAVPPGGERLDFRGIQAFDASTAVVMSSGPGDLSRVYKTVNGCRTWKLIFSNPYAPDGFFDAILFLDPQHGLLLGDPSRLSMKTPVEYKDDFRLRVTADGGKTWGPVSAPDKRQEGNGLHRVGDEAAFAASNSSMCVYQGWFWLATSAARVSFRRLYDSDQLPRFLFTPAYCAGAVDPVSQECGQPWTDFVNAQAPLNHSAPSDGIFSISFRDAQHGVAVGGDYAKPDETAGTEAYTSDGGRHWSAAEKLPAGYRTAVAYDVASRMWIAVGPNGTDVSSDDGRTWHPARPSKDTNESAGADRDWNALSLPFVVGPRGRVGRLSSETSAH
jgi:photosystem II stability/assembly factor-like uncharacterized protein